MSVGVGGGVRSRLLPPSPPQSSWRGQQRAVGSGGGCGVECAVRRFSACWINCRWGRRGALRVLMFERGGVGVSALGVCRVFVKWQVVVACPAMTTRVRCAHTTSPRPVSLRLLRARRPLRCRVLCRLLG